MVTGSLCSSRSSTDIIGKADNEGSNGREKELDERNHSNNTDGQSSRDRERVLNSENSYDNDLVNENFDENSHDNTCDQRLIDDDNESSDEIENEIESDNYDEIFSNNSSVSDSETEDYLDEAEIDVCFNKIMFESSKLTVRDIIVISTAFCLRFSLSDEARLSLNDIMKLCAGPQFNYLNLSKYMMSKCFSSQYQHINNYYYCCKCSEKVLYTMVNGEQKVKKHSVICEKCEQENVISVNSSNYFTSINLKYQIK